VSLTLTVSAQKKLKTIESYDLKIGEKETKKLFKSSFIITNELTLKDRSKIFVGDTIQLGPSSSKISNNYETIFIGKISTGLVQLSLIAPASTIFRQNTFVVETIKGLRRGGKVTVLFYLKDTQLKGLSTLYLSAGLISIERGELINPNAPMNRTQAIAKLKESKDLLDLGMLTQEEYDELKKELTPTIMGKN
tara:strand:- start:113 stop:691 length:579 start_codon:yes stop_codon:yes gene_type:complete